MIRKNGDDETAPGAHNAERCVLPRKTIELIEIALNAACISLHSDETCSSIRAALDAGATREEILMVLKMVSVMSLGGRRLRAAILDRCKGGQLGANVLT